jgi:hypothetical protein
MAKSWRPSAASHTPATYPMANVLRRKYTPFSGGHTSSPLEAAEAGTQTGGHSPQGCRVAGLFGVSPGQPGFIPDCCSAGAAPVRTERRITERHIPSQSKSALSGCFFEPWTRHSCLILTVDEAFMPDLSPVEERPFRAASGEQQNGLQPLRFVSGHGFIRAVPCPLPLSS